MNRPTKSLDAAARMGVYKRLADVPDRYRLAQHTAAYADRDVWQEFCEAAEYDQGSSEHYYNEVDRIGQRWADHMAERDRHHALAQPADVTVWCEHLLDKHSLRRAYDHWVRIERFYRWLQWHADYPHVYNPVLMAAVDGGAAAHVWAKKAKRHEERRERYREQEVTP